MKTPIPKELKEKINSDPFYQRCCLKEEACGGRLEIHHALIYAGRQVNKIWCLFPLCQHHHALADTKVVRPILVEMMRVRGGDEIKSFEKIKKL